MKIKSQILVGLACLAALPTFAESFRAPSVPLVTFDPYLSIWSGADHLADQPTEHWTKHPHSLTSIVRVDGRAYRLMGSEPAAAPALRQTGLEVTATRSIYDFENSKIHVTLTFT